jgi:hypothetical protein
MIFGSCFSEDQLIHRVEGMLVDTGVGLAQRNTRFSKGSWRALQLNDYRLRKYAKARVQPGGYDIGRFTDAQKRLRRVPFTRISVAAAKKLAPNPSTLELWQDVQGGEVPE